MTLQEEKILITQLNRGSKEAFRRLFDHYCPIFLAFAKNILHDSLCAEDVVQNVFLRVWVLRERLDASRSLRNYLLVAVRNEIYCSFRDLFLVKKGELEGDVVDVRADVEADCDAAETRSNIDRIVAGMPFRRRQIFEMSRWRCMCNNDIARELGLSVRTVEKHIECALRDLRVKLPVSIVTLITIL